MMTLTLIMYGRKCKLTGEDDDVCFIAEQLTHAPDGQWTCVETDRGTEYLEWLPKGVILLQR